VVEICWRKRFWESFRSTICSGCACFIDNFEGCRVVSFDGFVDLNSLFVVDCENSKEGSRI